MDAVLPKYLPEFDQLYIGDDSTRIVFVNIIITPGWVLQLQKMAFLLAFSYVKHSLKSNLQLTLNNENFDFSLGDDTSVFNGLVELLSAVTATNDAESA